MNKLEVRNLVDCILSSLKIEYWKYRTEMLKNIKVTVHLPFVQATDFTILWIYEIWSL